MPNFFELVVDFHELQVNRRKAPFFIFELLELFCLFINFIIFQVRKQLLCTMHMMLAINLEIMGFHSYSKLKLLFIILSSFQLYQLMESLVRNEMNDTPSLVRLVNCLISMSCVFPQLLFSYSFRRWVMLLGDGVYNQALICNQVLRVYCYQGASNILHTA